MKYINRLLQVLCLLMVVSSCSKKSAPVVDKDKVVIVPAPKSFRVVGYLFVQSNLEAQAAKIDYSKITHLNIAFINPDSEGNFSTIAGLAAVVRKAHDNNVKVLPSFAGGNPPVYLKQLLEQGNRAHLISSMLGLIPAYQFDGLDIDLEGDFVNENYEAFITELSAALKPQNKLLTVAVATWNSRSFSDKAVASFDFINVMSYDQTGPWRKDQPGPHSTYEAAIADLDHWINIRKVPPAKLNLGLPFYGYGFGLDIPESLSFGEIVKNYPASENVDQVDIPGKGTMYYNGLPTIKKKVALAYEKKAGGVMIWQLLGDADGANSLLNAIYTTQP